MHAYKPAPNHPGAVFVGQAAPTDGRESSLRIVFSDLTTPAARRRKDGAEFPLSLDKLEIYLRRRGYAHGDYAFLPEAEEPGAVQTGSLRPGSQLHTLGLRGQAPYAVREAGLWTIQMQSYHQAPAFFSLLQQAGVPVLRRERTSAQAGHTPLLVLAGPVWPNPLPLADFYDVLLLGKGEEVLARIAALCEAHGEQREHSQDRPGLLAAIAGLEGAYVPGLSAAAVRQARANPAHLPSVEGGAPLGGAAPEGINAQYLHLTVPEAGKMILSPEAGPRIREQVFRKTIAEQTLYDLIAECIAVGINRIQLCAILSVPPISPGVVDFLPSGFDGEQPNDLGYLAELARSIADQMMEAGLKPQPGQPFVQVECMPFVPAIGTDLQKAAFPSYAHYQARIRALQGMLGPYYHDVIEVRSALDQSSHLLQAFLERGESRAGLALWQVWRLREAPSLTPKEVLQAIRLSGQDWKGISAEYRGRRLPYEGLICWGDCESEHPAPV